MKDLAMLKLRTIEGLDCSGKVVLLRVDLNVPVESGRITNATRIDHAIPTIRYLTSMGAKLVLASHLGRPKGKAVKDMSLKVILPELERSFGKSIKFSNECVGSSIEQSAAALKNGDILLLENLRFYKEEADNSREFAQNLARLAEIYVNDAFSCSHRAHASIVGVPQFIPAYAGKLMAMEVDTLDGFSLSAGKGLERCTAIIGGKKISTKFKTLTALAAKVDNLIIGGAMANNFLKALGHEVGNSYWEEDMLDKTRHFLMAGHKAKLILPSDVVVLSSNEAIMRGVKDIGPTDMVYDLGHITTERIRETISASKLVLWNGPLGLFEDPRFDKATNAIARHVCEATKLGTIKSIVGGGDTVAALEHAEVDSNSLTYRSMAGGAFLEYLENSELPGVALLRARQ